MSPCFLKVKLEGLSLEGRAFHLCFGFCTSRGHLLKQSPSGLLQMSLGVCYFMPKQRELAGVGSFSAVVTCVRFHSRDNAHSLMCYSQQPFVAGALVCLHFANLGVKLSRFSELVGSGARLDRSGPRALSAWSPQNSAQENVHLFPFSLTPRGWASGDRINLPFIQLSPSCRHRFPIWGLTPSSYAWAPRQWWRPRSPHSVPVPLQAERSGALVCLCLLPSTCRCPSRPYTAGLVKSRGSGKTKSPASPWHLGCLFERWAL